MLLAACLWMVGSGVTSRALAEGTRIGYVDMKRLLDNAPQVIDGRARLESEFRARDQLLKASAARLVDLETRERREAAVMPKAAADSLHNEIVTLKRSLDRTRKQLSDDLKSRMDEELNRRWPEINDAVIVFARANAYDLVIPAPVLYASPAIDITDQVLEQLRKSAARSGAQ
ncbi:MAG: hypothetical protein COS34_10630 [Lysobacterales bacterium CG02_land_8_20_14_3_00_62_12]|nr:MAG: hypothetical protein COS34_10630 [Xanthomonadales bacterium CG02_land_8_20_14_3_00_62_12]